MRFLFKKAFQQDPSRGWANTRATDCKHAGRPEPWGRSPRAAAPRFMAAFLFSRPLFTLHSYTESFQSL